MSAPGVGVQVVHDIAAPHARIPSSRSGRRRTPSSWWKAAGRVSSMLSCTTATSASGNTWRSTDQVPYHTVIGQDAQRREQLLPRAASATSPGAG